jgi:16S rRNA processing protein RimM
LDRDWVTLALLLKARGIKGEIAAEGFGTRPERFTSLKEAYLFRDAPEAAGELVEIESVWEQKGQLVFKFRGVDSMTDAEKLVGAELRIPMAERAPAPEGEYYSSDLIGCEVVEKGGEPLGQVMDWQDYGAGGLLVVKGAGGELLVPFAKAICVEIDIAGRRIVADLPEGLKESGGR